VSAVIDIALIWLPVLFILGMVIYFGGKQMREYRQHVAHITAINVEIQELNRKNHEIAKAHLDVLTQIKSLLEDRKS
jgi:hypothetical protein